MKQTLGYEDDIKSMIDSYRFTVIAMAVVIVLITLCFAAVLGYMVLIQVPEVVTAAMADYFADYEVIP